MNCKPGDMAIYVGPCNEALGAIVMIVCADPNWPSAWIHTPEVEVKGRCSSSAWDKNLRPIRDQPGDDEMLRITGLPSETKQPELTT
jgi:hypothetical protein